MHSIKALCSILLFVCVFISSPKLYAQNVAATLPPGYYLTASEGVEMYDQTTKKAVYLDTLRHIPFKHIVSTDVSKMIGSKELRYVLSISLDAIGTEALSRFSPNLDRTTSLALLVNGRILFMGRIVSRIKSGKLSYASRLLSKNDLEALKLEIDKALRH
ncbi:hypothetical protein GCM10011387_30740 [Pedobacter quisquiliarum]|uniref:Uncharacterized protein n=1 Tax=Pedobacter quisquiliarum TaxID=1834438 RepID=A0A916UJ68_9SPHI|nr:hypothetical protein [Pedobacter quisquiliarum]GGC74898.1 hypothetical protein GCM10011387_30740 [Pedobacter quisquiliarum]